VRGAIYAGRYNRAVHSLLPILILATTPIQLTCEGPWALTSLE
jgi:hypothetical protein